MVLNFGNQLHHLITESNPILFWADGCSFIAAIGSPFTGAWPKTCFAGAADRTLQAPGLLFVSAISSHRGERPVIVINDSARGFDTVERPALRASIPSWVTACSGAFPGCGLQDLGLLGVILGTQLRHRHHRLQGQQGGVTAQLILVVGLLLELGRQIPEAVATGRRRVGEALAGRLLQGAQGGHGRGGAGHRGGGGRDPRGRGRRRGVRDPGPGSALRGL